MTLPTNAIRGTRTDDGLSPTPFSKVYTPAHLAAAWHLSEQSIRRLFVDEPGVFVLGDSNPRGRRGYTTLRIPEDVAVRVWRGRLSK